MRQAQKWIPLVSLVALPVIVTVPALWLSICDRVSIGFHHELYPGAKDVLVGGNPYRIRNLPPAGARGAVTRTRAPRRGDSPKTPNALHTCCQIDDTW